MQWPCASLKDADLGARTTLRVGGVEKRVENYFGGPELLRKLEDRIDALSGAAVWKQREQG